MHVVFNKENIVTDMPGMLLLSHGDFAVSALRCAEMIVGHMENVFALGFEMSDIMEDYSDAIAEAIAVMPEGSVILLDCFGGTPFNRVMHLLLREQKKIPVVAGMNLPMLIEASALRPAASGAELAARLTQTGKEGVIDIAKRMSQS